jgi:predicted dehydrogenase
VYFDIQNLLRRENLDGIFICTPNNMHYAMALASLEKKIPTLVEKPLALNEKQAARIAEKADATKTPLLVGMNYRFREDAQILKDFLAKNELGEPYYIKTGWLRKWSRQPLQNWLSDPKISGGGVMMDLGIQLIDLALWLLDKPVVRNVRAYNYNLFKEGDVEDSALAVIQTDKNIVITVEVSWRMHLENDMHYTHVYGKEGGALLNPLRLYKEMHGNLVNVTPLSTTENRDDFKGSFEREIRNFVDVIKGDATPLTPAQDGVYILQIIEAIYKSAREGKQIDLVT